MLLDDIEVYLVLIEQREEHHPYHAPMKPKQGMKPRAMTRGKVIWIVKDGKPVDFKGGRFNGNI